MVFNPELIEIGKRAKEASRTLMCAKTETKNAALISIADKIESNIDMILKANAIDLQSAKDKKIESNLIKRLELTPSLIREICDGVRDVAKLPDPVGEGEFWTRPNGLRIQKTLVPLGVVGIIYEARPNVTVDAAVLCLKSGNACILRGGSEAFESNKAIVELISNAIKNSGLPESSVQMMTLLGRENAVGMMRLNEYIDVIIPRGGAGLINSVVENATVPVIQTGTGVCHAFVHKSADFKKAISVVVNAKTNRPAVCNALETLLVDKAIANEFLPEISKILLEKNVELRGCGKVCEIISVAHLADEEDWSTEHYALILNVKVVDDLEDALNHIYKYSTKHSEVILTEDYTSAEIFTNRVDAAAVYINASTRFSDGSRFGFGAEIGISTQKLHARGPMGLRELTTNKYIVYGDGQIV